MKIIVLIRVKNAIKTIRQCLASVSKISDEIVIVDNGSTDGTISAYKDFAKITLIKKTSMFNEGRDRILAHKLAKQRNPNWIFWIDADTIIEKAATKKHFQKMMSSKTTNHYKFHLFHFWLSKTHYRVDGYWHGYTSRPQHAMWRNLPSAHFPNLRFHTGGIKGVGNYHTSLIRLKHYGYIDKSEIRKKIKRNLKLINDPRAFKGPFLDPENPHIATEKWQNYSLNSPKRYWDKFRWDLIYKFPNIFSRYKNPNSPITKLVGLVDKREIDYWNTSRIES